MAIKVNGTNVITDSRALNNITGADTATKNALAAAGVGGATKLITADAALTGGSTYSFSLTSDYNAYFLALQDLKHTGSGQESIYGRLTNSSGSAITSGYHTFKTVGNSSDTASNRNEFRMADAIYQVGGTYEGRVDLYIWIFNAQLSTQQTFLTWDGFDRYFSNSMNKGFHGIGQQRIAGEHNSFYIYPDTSSWGSSGRFSMWGVDL